MKIVFWNANHVHAGCSVNALTMALWHAMQLPDVSDEHVSFLQTSPSHFTLDYAMFGARVLEEHYFGVGMDHLLSTARSRPVRYRDAYDNCFSMVDEHLFYFIASRETNGVYFEQSIQTLPKLFNNMDENIEYNYLDLASDDEMTKKIFLTADIVVVNVLQNDLTLRSSIQAVEEWMKDGALTKQKLRFCIGSYETSSAFSVKNVEKKYPLMRGRSFFIPRNIDFSDAIGSGHLMEFLLKNGGSTSMHKYKGITDQKYFFDSLSKNLEYLEKEG